MTGRTLAFNLARTLALSVALVVVAALVWRSQERAQPTTPPAAIDPTTSAVGTEPSAPTIPPFTWHVPGDAADVGLGSVPSPSGTVNPSFLPSSKSLTISEMTDYFGDFPELPPIVPTANDAQLPPKQ